mmetsp:Transcript_26176/g.32264  ORF Transcript_26176/g.32264 Transcript_26176/m.32264 type:complete len:266 (-) Transcript_26176:116-913(-)
MMLRVGVRSVTKQSMQRASMKNASVAASAAVATTISSNTNTLTNHGQYQFQNSYSYLYQVNSFSTSSQMKLVNDDDDDDDANDTSNNEMGSVYKFIVTMPKADIFFPILKYKCKPALVPVPLRIQSRVRTFLHDCRVALQVSSNPSNQKHLSDITIVMSIPLNVIGETLATQPEGGIFNSEKRSVIWCVSELGSGEKFQLQAQFKLHKTVEEYGEHPSFPISLRCQSLYTHFSGITLECGDIPNTFPADVKSKIARRFRISHKEI